MAIYHFHGMLFKSTVVAFFPKTEQTEQSVFDLADYFQKSFSVPIKILLSDARTISQAHLI